MSDTELKIEIKVETGSVEPAIAQVKSAIEGLDGSKSSIAELGGAFDEVKSHLASMSGESESWASKLAGGVSDAISSVGKFAGGVVTIAQTAIGAGAKVYEFAESLARTAEENKRLATSSGLTTGQIQELRAVSTMTGTSVDTLAKGVGQLSTDSLRAASQNGQSAAALKTLGVSADDGKTALQRFFTIADGFQKIPSATERATLATQVFGQSGKDLLPAFTQGAAGLQQMIAKAQEYGAADTAVAQSAQQNGEALADSLHESELGWQGLTNVAADAFGPVLQEVIEDINSLIKAFIKSYTEGGIVADVIAAVKVAFEEVMTVIEAVATIFEALWDAVSEVMRSIVDAVGGALGVKIPSYTQYAAEAFNVFKNVVTIVTQTIVAVLDMLAGVVRGTITLLSTFGQVIKDVFTLNWGKISSDWKAGMDKIATDSEEDARRVKDAWAKVGEAIQNIRNGGQAPQPQKPGAPAAAASSPGKKHHGSGHGGGSGSGHSGGAASHGSASGDGVQKLEQELEQRKQAYEVEQTDQKTYLDFSKEQELAYWQEVLARTNLSLAQRNEALKKAEDLQFQIGQAAQQKREQAAKKAQDDQRQMEEQDAEAALQKKQGEIQAEEDVAKFRVQIGQETQGQLLAQEQDFENRRYALQAADLRRRALLEGVTPVEANKIYHQIDQLTQQHEQKLTQLKQQGIAQRTKLEHDAVNSISSSWSQAISKMVTLQASFSDTLKSLWQGVQQAIGNAISSILDQWIEKQLSALLLNQTTTKAGAAGQITSQAAAAAAGAYAATACIPFVGPELAPLAASTAYAGAMGMLGLLSVPIFDVGASNLSKDQFAFVHSGEAILTPPDASAFRALAGAASKWDLPASLSQPVATQASPFPANVNAPVAANDASGGDQHFHYHDHSGRLTADQIRSNRSAFVDMLREAHRDFMMSPGRGPGGRR